MSEDRQGAGREEGPGFERWSAGRKGEVVLRLLRGEASEVISREVAVPVHQLEEWRRVFLDGGRAGLRSRGQPDEERELRRVQAKLGEMVMRAELAETLLQKRGFADDLRRPGR
jgi:transposase-like protein